MFDELFGVDVAGLSDDVLAGRVVELDRARRMLDAAECATLAAFDARQVWAADGALTGAAWLRHRTGMSAAAARDKIRVASQLEAMPATRAALNTGELCWDKVRLLADAARVNAEAFARDEALLVDAAKRFGVDDLRRVIAHWKRCADPDGTTADAAAQWSRRRARLAQTFDGTWVLDGLLDPESGAIVKGVWDGITDELYRSEMGDAQSPAGVPLRSAGQRSADALVEMARRAAACDTTSANRPRPTIVVNVDYDVLTRRSPDGGDSGYGDLLSADAVRRLACDADYIRAVTDGPSEILDLGRATPTPNTAQRRALALRDGGCVFPSCDRPASWCDAHHLHPYRRGNDTGGPTDLDQLVLLCTRHHHLLHEGGYHARRDDDTGQLCFTRPDGTPIPTAARVTPIDRQPWRSPPPHRTNRTRRRTRIERDKHRARQRALALTDNRLAGVP